MKKLLLEYATYNLWANTKIAECLKAVPQEILVKETASSFKSIQATLRHMCEADTAWWGRLLKQQLVTEPAASLSSQQEDMGGILLQQSERWKKQVDAFTEEQLISILSYQNSRGEAFRQPVYQIIMHVFNHGTYHRGQIANMLRQLGITENIPQTDFIAWSRL